MKEQGRTSVEIENCASDGPEGQLTRRSTMCNAGQPSLYQDLVDRPEHHAEVSMTKESEKEDGEKCGSREALYTPCEGGKGRIQQ
jgi:hypothetical protein